MNAKGSKDERETVIIFNEDNDTASIWTASQSTYRRLLKRLGRAYLTEDGDRHAVFVFPKKWLNLPRFKAKRELTPSQASKLRDRVSKLHLRRAKRG